MKKYLIAALAVLPLFSQAEVNQLNEILITASRFSESSEHALYSNTVLTQTAIQAMQAQDLGQILPRIPGLQIGRNGGPGQASSIFMRGTSSDHTLIMLDGVPVQSGTTGTTALQHLMPQHIQRIEIVKGPASTLYGSAAIGGVIQLFTRPSASGGKAMVNAGLGTDNTHHVSASLQQEKDGMHTSLSLSRRSSNGYPPRTGSSIERGYRNTTLRGALGWDFADSSIEISHFQTQSEVEYLDFFLNPVDQDTHNSVTRLVYDQVFSDNWDSRLLLSRAIDKVQENQSSDHADTVRDSLDWQNTISLSEQHTLVAGLTISNEQTELVSFGSGYDARNQTAEMYMHNTWQGKNTRIQGGIRFTDHEQYGQHATWSLAAGHQLNAATHLYANAGTAFRAPSANDLYGFGGNLDFEPETSSSGEIGLRYEFAAQGKISLAGYYTEIDDLIESDPVTFTIEQVESARIQGIEFGYQQQSGNWSWSLDYVYQDAINQDQQTDLARRAKDTINASLRYQQNQTWIELASTYASKRQDSRFSNTSLAPYTTWDINASYALTQGLNITGKIHNLFDESYELASGYPAPGRFIGVELQYQLD